MGIMRSSGSGVTIAPPLILVIFSCFCVVGPYSFSHAVVAAAGPDTIIQGQEISNFDYLVSREGTFKLGFFSPLGSNNSYLGIWHNNVTQITAVWIANRDTPIADTSGALTIDDRGKLTITYSGNHSIVLNSNQTTTTTTTGNVTATLLDSGNFVLKREVGSSGSVVLWESFDHPTNTLLPGMKLGLNFKTHKNWSLSSWLRVDVPAPGAFTLGGNPNNVSQLLLWRRGDIYWTSGNWDGRILDFVPWLSSDNDEFNFNYVSNEDEKYFTYSAKKNSSSVSMWVVGSDGKLIFYKYDDRLQSFSGKLVIDCAPNSTSERWGCVGEKQLECRKGNELFEQRKGLMTGAAFLKDEDLSLRISDCAAKCLRNCSCIAYASVNSNGTGCQLWGGESSFNAIAGNQNDFYVLRRGNGKKLRVWWFIIAVAATIFMLFLCFLFYYLRRRYFKPKEESVTSAENFLFELGTHVSPSNKDTNLLKKGGKKGHELKLFSLASITDATNNFSSTNKLGEGGFGPVYKGVLPEGQEIAVKRLSRSSGQGLMEFKNEIILIAELQHMNLVRLLGGCLEAGEKILIYEYMPNKSLDSFLFDPTRRELLDWKKRFNIIEGIIQGLLYLHKYSRLRIIHRDLKASNILLDDEMNPKISDFGMARIFGRNESEASTKRVVGTYGYMSPEYAMEGIFSVKSDVYSFGVLLLEIVSGRRNTSFYNSDQAINLIGYAWDLWKEDTALELMDPVLGTSCPTHELLRCIHVGLLCVQESAKDRPTMSDVASMLTNETVLLPTPKQPAFARSLIEAANCSLNGVSISEIEAR